MVFKNDYNYGRRAGKQSGAFACMDNRPYDIVVIARFFSGDPSKIRQVQVYYSERNRVSSYVFDDKDPAFALQPGSYLEQAAKVLLGEIKSRVLRQDDFGIWYYTPEERNGIEAIAGKYIEKKPQMQRFVDELVRRSRIIQPDGKQG